jgi:hypothetical protein
MLFAGMFHRVALVRTDVSEEHFDSVIKVTRIGELETTLALTDDKSTLRRKTRLLVTAILILVTLMMKAILSSETSFLTRATRRNIPEDVFFRISDH